MVLQYPDVKRNESYTYKLGDHQTPIQDPYHWLEDPSAPDTQDFVKAQNTLFEDYIGQYQYKEEFKSSLTRMMDYEKWGCPFKRGSSYYFFHNSGLQPQSVLYQQASLTAEKRVFLDTNTLSSDGTVSLNTYGFSKSGAYFAYGLSASGSDWVKIHIKTTDQPDAAPLEESPIEWAKFTGVSWTHDDRGFFYNRYPEPSSQVKDAGTETDSNMNAFLCYHRIGTPQSQDLVCFKDADNPSRMFSAEVSDDGAYLVLTVSESCDPKNLVYIAPTNNKGVQEVPQWEGIVTQVNGSITNDDTVFYFVTTLNAPKKRVVKYDLKHPQQGFVQVIPEQPEVLQWDILVDENKLVLVYLRDVKHVIHMYDLHSGASIRTLPLPLGSIVSGLSGRREDKELFYSYSSFLTPGKIHRYDVTSLECTVFKETHVKGFQAVEFETAQVFYPSKDGTRIPMYIISKKGYVLNSENVTLLYGYGGFNVSVTPSFSVTWLTFIQRMKGIVAVANIRGGGEYGEEAWYNQGKLTKKQNVFDDFQYAAKYLISQNYTQPSKLAINGGSNGGLLVGACTNQTPELFGCAIADVGVLDMFRFHKFTIGHAWVSDYGNPDIQADYDVVARYSPVHNVVQDKEYPAVLLTTSDHDDRVVPLHSYKFIATLQFKKRQNQRPLLLRVETKAGHGAGKSTQQRIEEATDKFAFLALSLNAEWV